MVQYSANAHLPPMLRHYLECKAEHPDCFLFYQVGDFYELFFDDAREVSRLLNLTLTSRDKEAHDPIPMCGMPIRAAEIYVNRLVEQGFSVAIVDQIGEVGAKDAVTGKVGVSRVLSRIITPSIRLLSNDDGFKHNGSEGSLAAISIRENGKCDFAMSRVESGIIRVRDDLEIGEIYNHLSAEGVVEVVIAAREENCVLDGRHTYIKGIKSSFPQVALKISRDYGMEQGSAHLEGNRSLNPFLRRVASLLFSYVSSTHGNARQVFHTVEEYQDNVVMMIDSSTRANLELLSRGGLDHQGTLFSVLNETSTYGGKVLLKSWIAYPSSIAEVILSRQEVVQSFVASSDLRYSVRELLRECPPFERLCARLSMDVVTPRELGALRDFFSHREALVTCLSTVIDAIASEEDTILSRAKMLRDTINSSLSRETITHFATLASSPSPHVSEGKIFGEGIFEELDSLRSLSSGGRSLLEELESKERNAANIPTLKARSNNIIGFFFELTKSHADKVPSHFISKQSTTSSLRFITPELKALERDIGSAEGRVREFERDRFITLRRDLASEIPCFRKIGEALAELDVLVTFTEIGVKRNFCRPELVPDSKVLAIEEGRHPVLDSILKEEFVPNSLECGGKFPSCLIITGPNMGGKSTYLRQAGLLVIMAQMGAMVPARHMKWGIVDRVCARIGACDNLLEGESTFMVEMREVSSILRCASSRSLVLIDELGRGTSSHDGFALASTIIEWLIEKLGCRLLCATHYHELGDVQEQFGSGVASNFRVACERDGNKVIFSHKIERGRAQFSYGIDVARTAGLPETLVAKARKRLVSLQKGKSQRGEVNELPLFALRSAHESSVEAHREAETPLPASQSPLNEIQKEALSQLQEVNINDLTPVDALNFIHALQKKIG